VNYFHFLFTTILRMAGILPASLQILVQLSLSNFENIRAQVDVRLF